MAFIEEWASQEAIGDGRFQIGYAFDFFSLPKDIVVGAFERVRRAGVKRITCHIVGKLGFGTLSGARETFQDQNAPRLRSPKR